MPRRKLFITAALLVLLCGLSWARNSLYRDPVLLWQDTVKKSPNKARPHNNLGHTLKSRGELTAAIRHFERSIELNPANPNPLNNLATIYSGLGRKIEAADLLQKALLLDPEHKDSRYNLALLYYQMGLVNEAMREYAFIIQHWPASSEAVFARHMLAEGRDKALH